MTKRAATPSKTKSAATASAVRGRKSARRGRKPRALIASTVQPRRGSLDEWLEGLRTLAASAETAGKPRGACLVADPAGGPAMCVVVDKETCKLMKGTFVGGPC